MATIDGRVAAVEVDIRALKDVQVSNHKDNHEDIIDIKTTQADNHSEIKTMVAEVLKQTRLTHDDLVKRISALELWRERAMGMFFVIAAISGFLGTIIGTVTGAILIWWLTGSKKP